MKPFRTLLASLNIRPDEEGIVGLIFGNSLCIGLAFAFFYSAANAVFLSQFPAQIIPYAFIVTAALNTLIGFVYARLARQVPLTRLMVGTVAFLLISVLTFRAGLSLAAVPLLIFILWSWIQVLMALGRLQFFTLAANVFDLQQSKRLLSLATSGILIGSFLGGVLSKALIGSVGSENLLLFAAGALGICLLLVGTGVPRYARAQVESPETAQQDSVRFRHLLQDKYVVLIFGAQIFYIFGLHVIGYQLNNQAKLHYGAESAALGAFFADYLSISTALSVVAAVLITGRLINRFGLRLGLLTRPVTLIAGLAAVLVVSAARGSSDLYFWMWIFVALLDEVISSTIHDSASFVVYQPLPPAQRTATQVAVRGIVTPLAIGAINVLILLFNLFGFSNADYFAFFGLIILIGSGLLALIVFRAYKTTLTNAIEGRDIKGISLPLHDATTISVLRAKLSSSNPAEVIFALDLLDESYRETGNANSIAPYLKDLINHPEPTVRREVMLRIENDQITALRAAVEEQVQHESSPSVRSAAIRALCSLGGAETIDKVEAYLADPDPQIRLNAAAGLLCSVDQSARLLAEARITLWFRSNDSAERELAAQVVRRTGSKSFNHLLSHLLLHHHGSVRRAALLASGVSGGAELWGLLGQNLTLPTYGGTASLAFVAIGSPILSWLREQVLSGTPDPNTLIRVATICGKIGGQEAINLLRQYLHHPEGYVQRYVLLGLSQCGYRASEADIPELREMIRLDAARASWMLLALRDLVRGEELTLVRKALQDELYQVQQRVFLVLSFMYDAKLMLSVAEHIDEASDDRRAYALEIVDILVDRALKNELSLLLNHTAHAETSQQLHDTASHFKGVSRQTQNDWLRTIIIQPAARINSWTKAAALFTVETLHAHGKLRPAEMVEVATHALNDPNLLVKETAAWVLSRLDHQAYNEHVEAPQDTHLWRVRSLIKATQTGEVPKRPMYLTIEKVIILKSVSIFAEIEDESLAAVSELLETVEFHAGEQIIEKGAVGNSMYIVIDGKVRVHDGSHTLAEFGPRDIFGELSALDPEPRSASVTALTDTHLFRLRQDLLQELMIGHTEVLRGIVRVLCERLRASNVRLSSTTSSAQRI